MKTHKDLPTSGHKPTIKTPPAPSSKTSPRSSATTPLYPAPLPLRECGNVQEEEDYLDPESPRLVIDFDPESDGVTSPKGVVLPASNALPAGSALKMNAIGTPSSLTKKEQHEAIGDTGLKMKIIKRKSLAPGSSKESSSGTSSSSSSSNANIIGKNTESSHESRTQENKTQENNGVRVSPSGGINTMVQNSPPQTTMTPFEGIRKALELQQESKKLAKSQQAAGPNVTKWIGKKSPLSGPSVTSVTIGSPSGNPSGYTLNGVIGDGDRSAGGSQKTGISCNDIDPYAFDAKVEDSRAMGFPVSKKLKMEKTNKDVMESTSRSSTSSPELTYPQYGQQNLESRNQMRQTASCCDYVLEAEGQKLSVHRAVMVACSDYFRALLTGSYRESRENHTELQGVTAAGLKAIIEFAYTGKVELTPENLEDVLPAASLFQVYELMELCGEFLKGALTKKDCIDILNTTEIFSMSCRENVFNFILNVFGNLSDTDHLRFSASQLACLLAGDGIRIRSEYHLFRILIKWIRHDPDKREKDCGKLMQHIRLPLLSGDELEEASKEPLMIDNEVCKDLLAEAKYYHSNVWKQPSLQTSRTQVRGDSRCLVMVREGIFRLRLDCFDIESWNSRVIQTPPIPLSRGSVCVLENYLYFIGGVEPNDGNPSRLSYIGNCIAKCFRYDPRFNVWFEIQPMIEPRTSFACVALGYKLYVIGGRINHTVLGSMECYSIQTGEWETKHSLNDVSHHAASVCLNKIYVSGGIQPYVNHYSNMVQSYCVETDTWTREPELNHRRIDHCMASVAGKLYVLGGRGRGPGGLDVPSVEMFCPNDTNWTICKTTLRIQRAIGLVENNVVYIVGGDRAHFCQSYDPEEDQIKRLGVCLGAFHGKRIGMLTLPSRYKMRR